MERGFNVTNVTRQGRAVVELRKHGDMSNVT